LCHLARQALQRTRQFPRSPAKTISVFLPVDASRKRILAPGSIDSFAAHLRGQHSLRLIFELDAIFSELTAYIILLFAVLLFSQFALSEGQGKPDKRHANIDTDQTVAYLVECHSDASRLIVLKS
jgi:hypothetical protein